MPKTGSSGVAMEVVTTSELTAVLRKAFPDVAQRFDSTGRVPVSAQKRISDFVLGWINGVFSSGKVVAPYVEINYLCGQVDRLLEVKNGGMVNFRPEVLP